MTELAVVTPSFGPDFELCAALHRSVLAYSPASVRHHIIVPRADLPRFGELRGERTVLHDEAEFLPRSVRPLPGTKYSVNLRRPFPPLRGWILQQVIKLAATARIPADVVVLVDSDIEFVRPFSAATFRRDGVVRFYRQPAEIDQRLPRHVRWHEVARTLLGVPAAPPPYTDYVSSLLAWDPAVVRALLQRIESVTGQRWVDAVGSQLHFSEWTLYGVFVDEVLGGPAAQAFTATDSRCHAYWDETPLDEASITRFLGGLRGDDVAVMVSAKSRTPFPVRRAALAALAESGQ
ncbi:DUF6492 family protein [Micromonospora sp. NBC_01813]|uniref:DUF6492 family protein n=1 Tax=Micromonospora sp. NBC_01813 TaxID=2975988 RepID=UPI002DDBD324|nr:DUF6492 family protein [Micromonospora sp. NBC_01813]WSA08859.1 DUF6492 family protein [Micromonospora sp. NBC_01813]